ncbi:MAG: ABC transporter ATP-binding protein/permease [Lachnospiraceae bacterium]|nr:ABC transporter ATP-binding protein/permease [Lachnospiraceae bacterium]
MIKTLKAFFDFCDKTESKKLKTAMILGVFKALFSGMKIGAIAVIVQGFLDKNMTMQNIWMALGIMLVSLAGQFFISLKTTMLQCEAGYRTCANKRIEIAEHLRYVPMGFFNQNSLGNITNVTTNTMEGLADIATRVVMITTQGMLTTAVIILFIFAFDVRIAFIALAGILVYMICYSLMQQFTKGVAPFKHKADENVVAMVIEFVQGIVEVKNYNMIEKSDKRLQDAITNKRLGDTKLEFAVVPIVTIQNVVTKVTSALMCLASLKFYFAGTMTLFNCIMMLIASFMVYESLDMMSSFGALMRNINISITKANEILNIESMDIDGADMTPASYDIELKNVEFAYENKKIIDGVSLKIPQKTTAAIVGPSGGGKSTLCNLMARFWDVDGGEVLLGGKNVKDYSFDSLMKNFSFVFQSVYLFEDTIANNIRFGEPEASMDRVIEAAKQARCHDFIMELPDGYETIIGEGGASLSGGEKQRISIARAIMKDSPIIILDEATANVDPENEAELTAAIEALTREKTIIMIAHRLKTVQHADQIFVINDGRIAQQGTHEQLVAVDGIYKNFIDSRKEAVSWKVAKS